MFTVSVPEAWVEVRKGAWKLSANEALQEALGRMSVTVVSG